MSNIRLRGNRPRRNDPYPLGEIPDFVVEAMAKQIVHRLAIGMGDLEGNDFGTIFANSIGGVHRARPLGVADVEWNGCAWSVKTVKDKTPLTKERLRLISGRNSPDYSAGLENAHADISLTGRAVLEIWNARVNEALGEHDDLRVVVLVRNIETREFVLFEEEAVRFVPEEYEWSYTAKNNLAGHHKITGTHKFTWQFHGSQFTVLRDVPPSARRFKIVPNVPLLDPEDIISYVGFDQNWIEFI
ncbi:MAG: hypothetical protein OXG53_20215 [Chloroflexi bacterium]|nr:hypothetical protein [Chloroflexota bacterium]